MARLDLVFCTQTSWTLSKRYQIRANEKANPCIFLDKELDTGNMRYPAANNLEPICGLIKISAMYSAMPTFLFANVLLSPGTVRIATNAFKKWNVVGLEIHQHNC